MAVCWHTSRTSCTFSAGKRESACDYNLVATVLPLESPVELNFYRPELRLYTSG